MQIKEVSIKTGLSIKTIRFYEERGLIHPKLTEKNGKKFRDYSDTDIADLNMVAVLRKCLFSIDQIKTMVEHPELTPDVFTEYRIAMLTQRELLNLLADKAQALDPDSLEGPEVLARRLSITAEPLPLPTLDMEPHFGKLDEETPEERQEAFLRWQKQYKYRNLRKYGPPVASFLAASLLLLGIGPSPYWFLVCYLALILIWGLVYAIGTSRGYGFRVQYIRNNGLRGFFNDAILSVDKENGNATLLTHQMSGHGNLISTDYKKQDLS